MNEDKNQVANNIEFDEINKKQFLDIEKLKQDVKVLKESVATKESQLTIFTDSENKCKKESNELKTKLSELQNKYAALENKCANSEQKFSDNVKKKDIELKDREATIDLLKKQLIEKDSSMNSLKIQLETRKSVKENPVNPQTTPKNPFSITPSLKKSETESLKCSKCYYVAPNSYQLDGHKKVIHS